jgi:hypothetical protein
MIFTYSVNVIARREWRLTPQNNDDAGHRHHSHAKHSPISVAVQFLATPSGDRGKTICL